MHWQYDDTFSPGSSDSLQQGDILLPNEALAKSLSIAHGWFKDPKYLGFIVLTQSCDLVRGRGDPCKSPYVEIGVLRPFQSYLLSILKSECEWIGDRYFPASERERAKSIVEKIINQNEQVLGLFYLHTESQVGIGEPAVALLRVSIALRAREHYETLVTSRRGRLHPEFANRLGWMCGHLYSRVAVRDWSADTGDKEIARQLKEELLSESDSGAPKFVECSKTLLNQLRRGRLNLRGASEEVIERAISEHTDKRPLDRALEVVGDKLAAEGVSRDVIGRVQKLLRNDAEFTSVVKK